MIELGTTFTKEFKVSEKIHEGFIGLFQDKNPLHTDNKYAITKGFKGKVMHGNILNGFISNFIGECLPDKNIIIHSQDIYYKNPVYLNDNLHFSATTINIFESVNAIEFKFMFKNDESNIVAKGNIQIGLLR